MRQAPLMAKVEREEEKKKLKLKLPPKELSSQAVIASSLFPPCQGKIVHPDATYKYS